MHIELQELEVAVGSRQLITSLNASFVGGSMTALVGPSGSGKSTLLSTIAGYTPPVSGAIHFEGVDVDNVALMSQAPAILARRTVRDNVAVGALAAGMSYASALRRADDLMTALGLSHLADVPAYRTSGGERQRVAILRVIAKGDMVVLADEPTASLDPKSRVTVVDTLRAAAQKGAIVLIATHDDYVAAACDRSLSPWHSE